MAVLGEEWGVPRILTWNEHEENVIEKWNSLYLYWVGGCALSRFACFVTWSCPTLVTPWTVAHQTPLSMGFSRQEILKWAAISFSRGSSWPGIKPASLMCPVLADATTGTTWEAWWLHKCKHLSKLNGEFWYGFIFPTDVKLTTGRWRD